MKLLSKSKYNLYILFLPLLTLCNCNMYKNSFELTVLQHNKLDSKIRNITDSLEKNEIDYMIYTRALRLKMCYVLARNLKNSKEINVYKYNSVSDFYETCNISINYFSDLDSLINLNRLKDTIKFDPITVDGIDYEEITFFYKGRHYYYYIPDSFHANESIKKIMIYIYLQLFECELRSEW